MRFHHYRYYFSRFDPLRERRHGRLDHGVDVVLLAALCAVAFILVLAALQ